MRRAPTRVRISFCSASVTTQRATSFGCGECEITTWQQWQALRQMEVRSVIFPTPTAKVKAALSSRASGARRRNG